MASTKRKYVYKGEKLNGKLYRPMQQLTKEEVKSNKTIEDKKENK